MAVTSLGSFPGANDTDRDKRIPAAISALNKALAGDTASYSYMVGQKAGSATAVGKEAFRRALEIYDAQKAPAPVIAPTSTIPANPNPLYGSGPPDRRYGWRFDSVEGWIFEGTGAPAPATLQAPKPAPTPTVTMEGPGAAPIGFDTAQVFINPIPVVPSVRVTGIKPGRIVPINIGTADGGVITGPPAPDYAGPTSAPLADASFGYVAPTTAIDAGAKTTAATVPGDNKNIILLLAAAAILFMFLDYKRGGK